MLSASRNSIRKSAPLAAERSILLTNSRKIYPPHPIRLPTRLPIAPQVRSYNMPAQPVSQKNKKADAHGPSKTNVNRKAQKPAQAAGGTAAEAQRRLHIDFYRRVLLKRSAVAPKSSTRSSLRLFYKDFFVPPTPGSRIRFYRKNFGDQPPLSLRWPKN
jgi:hypothetical protein